MERVRKTTKTFSIIAGITTHTQTVNLRNTSLECYRNTNPLDEIFIENMMMMMMMMMINSEK